MVEGVSGSNLHYLIGILQKLFTHQHRYVNPAARQPLLPSDPCERRTGPAEPPPRRTPPKLPTPNSLSPNQPIPTHTRRCSSGTGPQRALDRSNKAPKARQRVSPASRAIPASAGPVPRSHPQDAHLPNSQPPTACPQTNPPQHTHADAAAGQGRSAHWIAATKPPKRDSATAPPLVRSLRAQDRSRRATPKTHHRVETSQVRPGLFD